MADIAALEAELARIQQEREQLGSQITEYEASQAPEKRPWEMQPASPPESFMGKVGLGVAESALSTALGAKDLIPGVDLSQKEKDVLGSMRRDVEASGFGGGLGSAVGELAQLAVPASKLAKAKSLQRGAKLGRTGLLAGETGLAALHGATKVPREGKTRTEEAIESGAWALGGGVLGEAVGPLARGFKKTPEGQRMIDEGVELTGAMASDSGLAKVLELTTSIFPLTSGRQAAQRATARGQAQELILNQARPFSDDFLKRGIVDADEFGKFKSTGQEGVAKLQNMRDKAYDLAWDKAGSPNQETLVRLSEDLDVIKESVPETLGLQIRRINDALNMAYDAPSPANLKRIGKAINKAKDKAWREQDEQAATLFDDVFDEFSKSLSKESQDILNEVNNNYGKYKAVEHAMSLKQPSITGEMSGADLMSGAKAAGKKKRQASGESPMFQTAQDLSRTLDLKDADPESLLSRTQRLASKAPKILPGFGRVTIGETPAQKRMKATAEALRAIGVDPATVGATIGG